MNITKYAIRHRLSVYFLILILCLGGVGVYVSMPRESFPEVEIPFILVYTIYPGVSPTDMETLVTRPIETELKAVSGIKEISSTTSEGLSSIAVEFNPETDIETALASVREKVDLAKSDLPPEAEDPRVQDMDFSQVPDHDDHALGPGREPAAHRGGRGDPRRISRRCPASTGST